MSDRELRVGWADRLLSLLVLAATVVYLGAFPLHLGLTDEAKQLHEATRILRGEVMYRDVFDLILPGWIYLMAAVFGVFGATLAAARATVAVIHGATAALLFLACRRLGVRREIAFAAAVAYLVVCQPAFPIASQHWLATLLGVAVLAILLAPWPARRRAFAAGVASGLLIAVHQQRGLAMTLGAAGFLAIESSLARRFPDRNDATSPVRQLLALGAGGLLVVGPLLVAIVAQAGFEPVWQALVVYPTVNYRGMMRPSWGFSGQVTRTFPRLLSALPWVLVPVTARLAALSFAGVRAREARNLALLLALSAASILSIWYLRDAIHIAFVAPIFFAALAESVEWTLRFVPRRAGALLGAVTAASIAVAGGFRLERNLAFERGRRSIPYASAFGRVDVSRSEVDLCEMLKKLLAAAPKRSLYVHPNDASLYLLLDVRNPTRFSFVLPAYHGERELREVVDSLAADRTPYVVTLEARIGPDDPIARFIEEHYEPITKRRRTGPVVWRLRGISAPT